MTIAGSRTSGEPPATPQQRIELQADTALPTQHGTFRVRAYRELPGGVEHLALLAGITPADPATARAGITAEPPSDHARHAPLVRVHSECITGEALASLKCECGPQLQSSLGLIQEHGGVVIYLRGQEGRGIGLGNKLRAYELQAQGADTLDANLQLGLPADARDYSVAAAILADLGITSIRLLTNNPDKVAQLTTHGVEVVERVALYVGEHEQNRAYLATKQERMGHLPPTVAADVDAAVADPGTRSLR